MIVTPAPSDCERTSLQRLMDQVHRHDESRSGRTPRPEWGSETLGGLGRGTRKLMRARTRLGFPRGWRGCRRLLSARLMKRTQRGVVRASGRSRRERAVRVPGARMKRRNDAPRRNAPIVRRQRQHLGENAHEALGTNRALPGRRPQRRLHRSVPDATPSAPPGVRHRLRRPRPTRHVLLAPPFPARGMETAVPNVGWMTDDIPTLPRWRRQECDQHDR